MDSDKSKTRDMSQGELDLKREGATWLRNPPKISYNKMLGRPVFVNEEAFFVCLSGASDPSIFSKVLFDTDENFDAFFKESTGQTEMKPELVSQFINGMVNDSMDEYQNFELNQGMDVFTVPQDNPNTSNQNHIAWMNTEKLNQANQKFNDKLNDRIFNEAGFETTEGAVFKLHEELEETAKTFKEFKENNEKNS